MNTVAHGVLVPIAGCVPHPRNYNQPSPEQIAALVSSLGKFGQVRSIVVQDDDAGGHLIVAGHGVWEAARAALEAGAGVFAESEQGQAGALSADVIPASWTYVRVLAYLAADNELARLGDPDREQLALLVRDVAGDDLSLALLAAGSKDDLEALLLLGMEPLSDADDKDIATSPDIIARLQEKWGTALGQVWEIPSKTSAGVHRVMRVAAACWLGR